MSNTILEVVGVLAVVIGLVIGGMCLYTSAQRTGIELGRKFERDKWGLPTGDGVTNDSEGVQRILDRASNREAWFAPGVYRIEKVLK